MRGTTFALAALTLTAAVAIAASISMAGGGPPAQAARIDASTPLLIVGYPTGGGVRGIVDARGRSDRARTKVHVALGGLEPGGSYVGAMTSSPCSAAPSRGTIVLGYSFGATNTGSHFRNKSVKRRGKLARIRSLRLFMTSGDKRTQVACAATRAFTKADR